MVFAKICPIREDYVTASYCANCGDEDECQESIFKWRESVLGKHLPYHGFGFPKDAKFEVPVPSEELPPPPLLPEFEEQHRLRKEELRKKEERIARNLSEPIRMGNFDKLKKKIYDKRSSKDFVEGHFFIFEKKVEDGRVLAVAVYKDLLEFRLLKSVAYLTGDENDYFSNTFYNLEHFEKKAVKYIGQRAVDYALTYSSTLNSIDAHLDELWGSDDFMINGLKFTDEQFYEFLSLVNEVRFFPIE